MSVRRPSFRDCVLAFAALGLLGPPALGTPARSEPIEKPADGVPTVHLDRLDFPSDVPERARLEKHLRATLRREARRAVWGAGRENRIEYRFSVRELSFSLSDGVLRVHCSAIGRLPGGQSARGELSFGGAPSERTQLATKVLDVVARGVVTRLAELERQRRGLR